MAPQVFEALTGFRKQHPSPRVPEKVIDFIEKPIKIVHHSDIGEDAKYKVLPPLLLRSGV
jgi:hypothetical protein